MKAGIKQNGVKATKVAKKVVVLPCKEVIESENVGSPSDWAAAQRGRGVIMRNKIY